jgi:hypothetical protein
MSYASRTANPKKTPLMTENQTPCSAAPQSFEEASTMIQDEESEVDCAPGLEKLGRYQLNDYELPNERGRLSVHSRSN